MESSRELQPSRESETAKGSGRGAGGISDFGFARFGPFPFQGAASGLELSALGEKELLEVFSIPRV